MTTARNPLQWFQRALELSYTAEESNTEPVDSP